MSRRLRSASFHVVEGRSVVAPMIIEGLPAQIEALGTRWRRKREFHLTVVPATMIEAVGAGRPGGDRTEVWDRTIRALSGRVIDPITVRDEVRRVSRPTDDLETLIVMVDVPALSRLYRELSSALETRLAPPPTHVTLFSTDPAEGIGIADQDQLAERAPPLTPAEQREVREAMAFDQVFVDEADANAPFTPGFGAALDYASSVHRGQRHRGRDVPYLAHLIAVAALVAEDGGSELEVIAALLHDAAEDHGGESRLSDIELRFGREVAAIVRALSDSLEPQTHAPAQAQPEPEPQPLPQSEPQPEARPQSERPPAGAWRARKERYLAALQRETDARVLRVSNADKLHNARTLLAEQHLHGEAMWQRHHRAKQDELWYYHALADTFAARRPASSMLVRELAETFALLSAG